MMGPSAMSSYFREIAKTPLLSAQEERSLFRRLRRGDQHARHHVGAANQRLVVSIAKKHLGRGLPLADLVGEGNVGLMRAIDRFQLSKGCRFVTYAVYWIRQAISRAVLEKVPTVRPPVDLAAQLPAYRRTVDRLHERLGRRPFPQETARTLGVTRKHLGRLEQAAHVLTAVEALPESDAISPEPNGGGCAALRQLEASDMVRALMRLVTQREREILTLRYGLAGGQPLTCREVGDRVQVTRARIAQIERRALNKMLAHVAGGDGAQM